MRPNRTDLERENARLRESQAFLRDLVTALVFSRGTRTAFVDIEGTKQRTPRPIIYTRTDKETKLLHIEIGESVTINPPNET